VLGESCYDSLDGGSRRELSPDKDGKMKIKKKTNAKNMMHKKMIMDKMMTLHCQDRLIVISNPRTQYGSLVYSFII
jgi:hypothetical protein